MHYLWLLVFLFAACALVFFLIERRGERAFREFVERKDTLVPSQFSAPRDESDWDAEDTDHRYRNERERSAKW